jgi:hypothetical protein
MGGVYFPLKSFADFPIKSRVLGRNRFEKFEESVGFLF